MRNRSDHRRSRLRSRSSDGSAWLRHSGAVEATVDTLTLCLFVATAVLLVNLF
jgi:hypothetical protein